MRTHLARTVALCAFAAASSLAVTGFAQTPVTVTVTKSDCTRLVKHLPDPGVAYEPGVDVRGRPVAPADLGAGGNLALPEAFELDIEIDLQERFGVPANRALFDADAELGRVVVGRDGRAFFNDAPLHDEAVATLIDRCQDIFYGRPRKR